MVRDALAGMEPHAHADGRPIRPRLSGQAALRCDGRSQARGGTREDGEETVALGQDLHATVRRESRPDELPMARQDRGPDTRESLGESGGALDIGEQEGDRAGGQAPGRRRGVGRGRRRSRALRLTGGHGSVLALWHGHAEGSIPRRVNGAEPDRDEPHRRGMAGTVVHLRGTLGREALTGSLASGPEATSKTEDAMSHDVSPNPFHRTGPRPSGDHERAAHLCRLQRRQGLADGRQRASHQGR